MMDAHHPLAGQEMIVAAELGGHGRNATIYLAAPMSRAEIELHFQIVRRQLGHCLERRDQVKHAVLETNGQISIVPK